VKCVLFRETFDCSLEYSSENPLSDTKKHIDVDKVQLQCKHQLGKLSSTPSQLKFFTDYLWDRSV